MRYLDKVSIIPGSIYILEDENKEFDSLEEAIKNSTEGRIIIRNKSVDSNVSYPESIFSLRYRDAYNEVAKIAPIRYLFFNEDTVLYEEIPIHKSKYTIDENIFDFEYIFGDKEISIEDKVEYEDTIVYIGFQTFYDFNTGEKIKTFNRESILSSKFIGNRILGPLCWIPYENDIYDDYIPLGLLKKVES